MPSHGTPPPSLPLTSTDALPESQLAAVAIASAVVGYCLAMSAISRRMPRSFTSSGDISSVLSVDEPREPTKSKKTKKEDPIPADGELDDASDSEDERAAVTEAHLSEIAPGKWEECKLVLVVNQELGMGKGKIAAQCGHATLACYKTLLAQNPKLLKHWEQTGQAKVAVKCTSSADLLRLQAEARKLNLCARSIQDAGRTQIAAGSRTVLGIGPGPVKLVNQVTGGLKLL